MSVTITKDLRELDPEIFEALDAEDKRQQDSLEMIASENFVSKAVLKAISSSLTNKYAEGYPSKRYYNGCEQADRVEELAITRAKKLFGAKFANVQPHSGSQANMASLFALVPHQSTIMGMDLNHGGHLTHGSRVNFSGRHYQVVSYGVRENTHRIDYDDIYKLARENRPKLIIAGFSAYSRILDFKKFREIADEVGALLLADIAHIAGLVAVGEHPSSVGVAHVTTSTTHKTLRGPRGGIILCEKEEHAKAINSQVFPGIQGGPFMHVIAGKAVAFQEALDDSFGDYIRRVKKNASALAESFLQNDLGVVSGGTDNHIVLLNLRQKKITGVAAANALHAIGITANKNAVPFDPNPPMVTSGVRFGSPALTTRGFGEEEFFRLGHLISTLIKNIENMDVHAQIRSEIHELTETFPMDHFRLT